MVVQLEGFSVSCGIKATKATGTDKLFGEEDRKAQYLIEFGGKKGVGIVCFFGEAAKELLIDLRRGHQRIEAKLSESLELGHLVSFRSKNVECRDCGESSGAVAIKSTPQARAQPSISLRHGSYDVVCMYESSIAIQFEPYMKINIPKQILQRVKGRSLPFTARLAEVFPNCLSFGRAGI